MFSSPARIVSIALLFSTVLASLGTSAMAQGGGGGGGSSASTNNGPRSMVETVEHWAKTGVGAQGASLLDSSMPGGKEQLKPGSLAQGGGEAQPEKIKCSDLGDGSCQWYDKNAGIPASAAEIPCSSKGCAGQAKSNSPHGLKGERASDTSIYSAMAAVSADEVANLLNPEAQSKIAQAEMQAQAQNAGNSMGEVEHNQASSAIDFCGKYLENFTVQGGNKWNQIRDHIFVPIGILLLLPGAVLTQVKAIVAAGTPVVAPMNPFEGILRSIVAVFLIPCTYLVINYGIDVANSITYTINSEYTRLFGSDMYRDAICAQLRAFPVRQPSENRNAYDLPTAIMGTALMGGTTPFAKLEATLYANKIDDPCAGLYILPPDRADEALPSSAIMAKLASNASNMALTTTWNILCAFQMAYLYYLWCVGPVVAGLWVWPMKQLRDALPSWVEGVITLCFWSLFWNTTVLLMACFRGVDETGTIIMSALNFLSTACVKFAFDFAGLVRAAGQEAAKMAEQAMEAAKGGGGGGGGGGASAGAKGGGASAGGQGGGTAGASSGGAARSANFAGGGVKPGVGTGTTVGTGAGSDGSGASRSLVSSSSHSSSLPSNVDMSDNVSSPPTSGSTSGDLASTQGSSDFSVGAFGNNDSSNEAYFGVANGDINTPGNSLLADMGMPPSFNDNTVNLSAANFDSFTDASSSNFSNFMGGDVNFSGSGHHAGSEGSLLAGGASLTSSGDTHHNLFGSNNDWSSINNANHDWTTNNAWNQTNADSGALANADSGALANADNDAASKGLMNFDQLLDTNMPLPQADSFVAADSGMPGNSDINNASPSNVDAPQVQGQGADNYLANATYDQSQQINAYDQSQQQANYNQSQLLQQQEADRQAAALAEANHQPTSASFGRDGVDGQAFASASPDMQPNIQGNIQGDAGAPVQLNDAPPAFGPAPEFASNAIDPQVTAGPFIDGSSNVNIEGGNNYTLDGGTIAGAPAASEPAFSVGAPEIASNTGSSAISQDSYQYQQTVAEGSVIGGANYLQSDIQAGTNSSTFAETANNSVVSYTDPAANFSGYSDSSQSGPSISQGSQSDGTVNYADAGTVTNFTGDTSFNNTTGQDVYAQAAANQDAVVSAAPDTSSYAVNSNASTQEVVSQPVEQSVTNNVGYAGESVVSANVSGASYADAGSAGTAGTSGTTYSDAGTVNSYPSDQGSIAYTSDSSAANSFMRDGNVMGDAGSYTAAPYAADGGSVNYTSGNDAQAQGQPPAEYVSQSVSNNVAYAGESIISAGSSVSAEAQAQYDSISAPQSQFASYPQSGDSTGVNVSYNDTSTSGNANPGYIDAPVSGVLERPANDSASIDYQSTPWNVGSAGSVDSYPTISSIDTSSATVSYDSQSSVPSGTTPTYEGSGYTAASLSEQGPSVFGAPSDQSAAAGYAVPIASGYASPNYERSAPDSSHGAGEVTASGFATSAYPTESSQSGSSAPSYTADGSAPGSSNYTTNSYGGATGSEGTADASYTGGFNQPVPTTVNYSEPSADAAGSNYVPAIGAGYAAAAEPSVTYSNPAYERMAETAAPMPTGEPTQYSSYHHTAEHSAPNQAAGTTTEGTANLSGNPYATTNDGYTGSQSEGSAAPSMTQPDAPIYTAHGHGGNPATDPTPSGYHSAPAGGESAAQPSAAPPNYAPSHSDAVAPQPTADAAHAPAATQNESYPSYSAPSAEGAPVHGPHIDPVPAPDSHPGYFTSQSESAPSYYQSAPSSPGYEVPSPTYSQSVTEAAYNEPRPTESMPAYSTQPQADPATQAQLGQGQGQQDVGPQGLPLENQNQPALVLAPITNESARPIPDGSSAPTAGQDATTAGYEMPVHFYQPVVDNSAGLAAEIAQPHFSVSAETYERSANVEPIHDYGHALHGTEPSVTLTASAHDVHQQVEEACVQQKVSVFTAAMGAAVVTRVATGGQPQQQHLKPAAPSPQEVTVSSMPAQQSRGISLLARALGPAASKRKQEPVAPPPMHDSSSQT